MWAGAFLICISRPPPSRQGGKLSMPSAKGLDTMPRGSPKLRQFDNSIETPHHARTSSAWALHAHRAGGDQQPTLCCPPAETLPG